MILIVQSLFNEAITEKLVNGAIRVCDEAKFPSRVIQAPGALEIPLLIKFAWAQAQRTQEKLAGVIACGAVVKGDTYHFEVVANESARAIMDLSVELRLPIGNAILTTYTMDQALERAGGEEGNKGEEAARTVLSLISLKEKHGWH